MGFFNITWLFREGSWGSKGSKFQMLDDMFARPRMLLDQQKGLQKLLSMVWHFELSKTFVTFNCLTLHGFDFAEHEPVIVARQQEQTVFVGSSIELKCDVNAPALSVKWSRANGNLPPSAYIRENILSLANVQVDDAGRYICETQGPFGPASDFVEVKVECKSQHGDNSSHCLWLLVNSCYSRQSWTLRINLFCPACQSPGLRSAWMYCLPSLCSLL